MRDIRERFQLVKPSEDQKANMATIREVATTFAIILSNVTPPGPRRERALEKIEEAVWIANRGIAEKGLEPHSNPPGACL